MSKLGFALAIAAFAFTAGWYAGKATLGGRYAPQAVGWESGFATTDGHFKQGQVFCGEELADGRHVTWFENSDTCHQLEAARAGGETGR